MSRVPVWKFFFQEARKPEAAFFIGYFTVLTFCWFAFKPTTNTHRIRVLEEVVLTTLAKEDIIKRIWT
eukprot:ctg_781.g365